MTCLACQKGLSTKTAVHCVDKEGNPVLAYLPESLIEKTIEATKLNEDFSGTPFYFTVIKNKNGRYFVKKKRKNCNV